MKEESVIIELDTILEYRDGQVYIKKMNTSEMSVLHLIIQLKYKKN